MEHLAAALDPRRGDGLAVHDVAVLVVAKAEVFDAIPGITLERMAFPPRSRVTGIPHTPGSREYLICETGRVTLTTESQRWELDPGDVVVYRGDQSHGYYNPHDVPAVVFTLIMPG